MPTVESNLAHNPGIQSAQAGQVTVQRGTYELTAAQAIDDTLLIRTVRLPAQHRMVAVHLEHDDLDMGAAALATFGIEDTVQDPADTTDLVLFESALSIQAAAVVAYKTAAMLELAAVNYDRYLTFGIGVAAATGLVGGIAVELTSRPDLASHEGNFSP
jgi:hypothetical protein